MKSLDTNPKTLSSAIQSKPDLTLISRTQHTKWVFFALCFYLLSQSFLIPLVPIGSWAIWPTLTDLAIILLAGTALISFQHLSAWSNASRSIFLILTVILFGSACSYLFYFIWADEDANGIRFGIFQIYRLIQFFLVFWITAHVPLQEERIKLLRRTVDIALLLVIAGVVITYAGLIPLASVTAHLPQEGAWIFYEAAGRSGGKGLGFISYNYAYTALQVIMLMGLRVHLSLSERQEFSSSLFLFASIIACFLSESRAGLAGMLVFAITFWFKKLKYGFLVVSVLLIVINFLSIYGIQVGSSSSEESILERQKTLLDSGNSENLSGRDQIWSDRVEFLDEEPIRWLVGSGFGSAIDSGNFAHMLPLQLILETGLIGLIVFGFLFHKILFCLYQRESGVKPIFWVTIALLITSITQETFYPVPAFTHFIGFYLCSVAIALRLR